jgi:outer membrane receptor for ferrienterochelin and colicins
MRSAVGAVAALLLLLDGGALAAQVGAVVDRSSGAAVPMAQVLWKSGRDDARAVGRTEADVAGRFHVGGDWVGDGWIEVRALGHRTLTVSRTEAEALDWRLVLEPDPLELESVVVTAMGRAQRRSEVSVPIATISTEEIQVSGAASADELLAEMPGLQTSASAPVGSNIQIRGIGDSRVLVLVDGQPAAGALLENRDLSRISLSGVERVEVVKGPLSSLYGSDALGGVINVITREPPAGFQADASALSGGGGRYEAHGTASGGGELRYRVTGSWRQQDRVPGLDDAAADAFARVWDVRSTLRWIGSERLRVRGDFSFLRERQRWPVGGGFSGFNDNRGLTGWTEATLSATGGEWTARLFGQDYEHLYRSARGSAPIAGSDEEMQKERLWKAGLGYSASVGAHRLDVGAEGAWRSIESPDKILENRAADEQLDLFAQDAWTVGPAIVSAGARATLNDRWGNAVSPTLGVTGLPTSSVRLRAVVGRGFRAPSFKELAWDFANVGAGYTVQGFADLEPETSWNVTAGVEWAPSSVTSLGVEAYTNRIDNLIETAFVGNNPSGLLVYSPRNVAEARTRGVEITGSARLGGVRVQGEYVLLDARSLGDDLPLDRRARHSGRVRVGNALPVLDGLLLNLTGHVTGEAPLVGVDEQGRTAVVGTQERFVSLDAHAALQLPQGVRLVVGVDNLLDARPDGWQAVVERRFRVGLEAHDLF